MLSICSLQHSQIHEHDARWRSHVEDPWLGQGSVSPATKVCGLVVGWVMLMLAATNLHATNAELVVCNSLRRLLALVVALRLYEDACRAACCTVCLSLTICPLWCR